LWNAADFIDYYRLNVHVVGAFSLESCLDILESWIKLGFKNEHFSSLGSRSGLISCPLGSRVPLGVICGLLIGCCAEVAKRVDGHLG
jgi:hypothetical protein